MYKQPNFTENFKVMGPAIFSDLSFVAIYISELFFIISGAHDIIIEVKKNKTIPGAVIL